MSDAAERHMFSDGELTAYLDGELGGAERARLETALRQDEGLRDRLERLAAGGRPFEASLVPLLKAAPTERMEARLAGPLAAAARPQRRAAMLHRPALALGLAILLAFLAGIAADRAANQLAPEEPETAQTGGWREAVATYVELYTEQSLMVMPDDAEARAEELAGVAAALGLPLAPESVEIPGAAFRRAQLLQYDDKPLGHVTYLDIEHGPLAFCLIRNGRPDAPLQTEERHGLNVVHWNDGGIGYMLIGRAPFEALRPRAELLAERI